MTLDPDTLKRHEALRDAIADAITIGAWDFGPGWNDKAADTVLSGPLAPILSALDASKAEVDAMTEAGNLTKSLYGQSLKDVEEIMAALASSKAEVERLRKALKPFADEADCYPREGYEGVRAWELPLFTVGHLRRARAALGESND